MRNNIEWVALLDYYNIDYVIGPRGHVRAGHVGIDCPFCQDDNKKHYSINLETGQVRGCWRDSSHWRSPVYLVAALTQLPIDKVKEMLGEDTARFVDNDDQTLLNEIQRNMDEYLNPQKFVETPVDVVELPDEFQLFGSGSVFEKHYANYMKSRGYTDLADISDRYQIGYCATGKWKNRIIFPLYYTPKGGQEHIAGYQTRDITGQALNRYMMWPGGGQLDNLVWEGSTYEDYETLVIVEGPFDGLKLDYAAQLQGRGVAAAALLTNRIAAGRLARIIELSKRAQRTLIILDQGEEAKSYQVLSDLAIVDPEVIRMPDGFKDPDEFSIEEAQDFLDHIAFKSC